PPAGSVSGMQRQPVRQLRRAQLRQLMGMGVLIHRRAAQAGEQNSACIHALVPGGKMGKNPAIAFYPLRIRLPAVMTAYPNTLRWRR
ncbi:hypothetical protein, partial [Rivihabitans pingtungensis]|uniref:hypothetical protein n=1 Tax=Rivihabitans pingtungensis TaxID=1054498 RepID=UPI0028A202E0